MSDKRLTNLPKPQQMIAVLQDKQEFNPRYVELTFELKEPPTFEFLAGQYLSIQVSPEGERRAYSIASPPSLNHGFRFLVDLAPGGVGTSFLKNLTFGDQIKVLGPLGHFVVDQSSKEQALVFVGTGSGIAPLRSMIDDLLVDRQDKRPIRLYWGMRHESELFWLEDFENLNEQYKNFEFYPVISQPVGDWPLSTGHVTDMILAHKFEPQTGFYLCGRQTMIQEVTQLLKKKHQVNDSFIHFEKYY